jgi:hypothetical protein
MWQNMNDNKWCVAGLVVLGVACAIVGETSGLSAAVGALGGMAMAGRKGAEQGA